MQRGRAPSMLIGGQRATILQPNTGGSVQQGVATATTTRVVRPNQSQQPGIAQTPVRMVKIKKMCLEKKLKHFRGIGE